MEKLLEMLRDGRDFLIRNFEHVSGGRNPIFVVISMIAGIILIVIGLKLEEKDIESKSCIILGSLVCLVNVIQLIYKKYI